MRISTNVAYFKQYFTDAYATFKKPIWITEVRVSP